MGNDNDGQRRRQRWATTTTKTTTTPQSNSNYSTGVELQLPRSCRQAFTGTLPGGSWTALTGCRHAMLPAGAAPAETPPARPPTNLVAGDHSQVQGALHRMQRRPVWTQLRGGGGGGEQETERTGEERGGEQGRTGDRENRRGERGERGGKKRREERRTEETASKIPCSGR